MQRDAYLEGKETNIYIAPLKKIVELERKNKIIEKGHNMTTKS